jgi:MraZ protein
MPQPPVSSSPTVVFTGTFRHALDAKNRLSVPAGWRFDGDENRSTLMLLHDVQEPHLVVLPPVEAARRMEQAAKSMDDQGLGASDWTLTFANATSFGLDAQRRVTLPAELKDAARIDRDCVLVGAGPVYRIYAPEAWEAAAARIRQLRTGGVPPPRG